MTGILVGDIGGTNFRLGVSTPDGLRDIESYKCAAFDGPGAIIKAYLGRCNIRDIQDAIFAPAGPVDKPQAFTFTNIPAWGDINFPEVGKENGIEQLRLINDFVAQAWAVSQLPKEQFINLTPDLPFTVPSDYLGAGVKSSPDLLTWHVGGPGTGLGVCTAVVTDGKFKTMQGEGGHFELAVDVSQDKEIKLLKNIQKQLGIDCVTHEAVACGPGLVRAYNAVLMAAGQTPSPNLSPKDIEGYALDDSQYARRTYARRAINLFAHTLGRNISTAATLTKSKAAILTGGLLTKMRATGAFNQEAMQHLVNGVRRTDLKDSFLNNTAVVLVDSENIEEFSGGDHTGVVGVHNYAQSLALYS
jgi:glucokinase